MSRAAALHLLRLAGAPNLDGRNLTMTSQLHWYGGLHLKLKVSETCGRISVVSKDEANSNPNQHVVKKNIYIYINTVK